MPVCSSPTSASVDLIMDTSSALQAGLWNIQGLDIPNDVSHCIVALLPVWDVCSVGSCSRDWRAFCSSNFIWHILCKQRWCARNTTCRGEESNNSEGKGNRLPVLTTFKGWRAHYICLHKQMASGATSVIDYVKAHAVHDSVEVAEYQKAMALLCSVGLEFQDVQMFLLASKHSVLANLLGIHYCIVHLKIQDKDARAALINCKVGKRQVCLRWWSLGGWTNGFRRHDEMHVCITSLIELTELARRFFLEVIDRGTRHEVLRVQISADFKSSAWVARSMHSQR